MALLVVAGWWGRPPREAVHLTGEWALQANGYRLKLAFQPSGRGWKGQLVNEAGHVEELDQIDFRPGLTQGQLTFRRSCPAWTVYPQRMAGRFSHQDKSVKPAGPFRYPYQAEGVQPVPPDWKVGPPTRRGTVQGSF